MSTILIGNIKWRLYSHEGKTAYVYGKSYAIAFEPASKAYCVLARGKVMFASRSAAESLQASTEIVLDDCASQYIPVWNW